MKTNISRKTAIKERPGNGILKLAAETIALDFPQEDELLNGTDYTLRVDAPETVQSVEVSINQGPWQPCRRSSGYWWYDWTGIMPGPHQARARMRNAEGRVMTTLARHFRAANHRGN